MFQQFKLTGERHAGSRSQLHVLADGRLKVIDHRHHIPAAGINIDPAGWSGIFRFQHRRAGNDTYIRHIPQRDLLLHRGQDRHLFQCLRAVPVVLRITDINRVPGHALDRFPYRLATNGGGDKQLHIPHRHTVAGCFFTINIHINVTPPFQPLCKSRHHAGYGFGDRFNALRRGVDIRQNGA